MSPAICGAGTAAIDPPSPPAPLATADVSCGLTDIGCLGKVDGGDDGAADPYGDPRTVAAAGGCSAGAGAGWLLAALVALSSRRRSRRR
jgi:hypothetical protein